MSNAIDNTTYKSIEKYADELFVLSTPERPAWNIEAVIHNKKPSWNYIDGCMLNATLELCDMTGDKCYFDFVKSFVDYFVDEDGSIKTFDESAYNLDSINEGRTLFALYFKTNDIRYKRAADQLYGQLMRQPRNAYGSFWHKKIYPDQVWLDGLYMAQVFYYRYDREFLHGDGADTIAQFRNVERFMKDKATGLYYHGFDASKKSFWANKQTGLSENFWLRATGWYFAALADVTSYMEDTDIKEEFKGYIKNAIDSVLKFKDKASDMFYQVVDKGDREGNYLETSGSALIAYSILKSVNSGLIDRSYAKIGKAVFDGICKKYLKTDSCVELGGICLVAGLGPENKPRRDGSFEYYISEPVVSTDAKGVAPFIMAYVELKKLITEGLV